MCDEVGGIGNQDGFNGGKKIGVECWMEAST